MLSVTHRRWCGDGTWERILDELRRDADVGEGVDWTVAVDSGMVRAHQHAAGARHAPPTDIAAEVVAPAVGGHRGRGRITGIGPVGWAERRWAGPTAGLPRRSIWSLIGG